MSITFCVWSPDKDTFWQSWIAAGICSSPNVFTDEYSDSIEIFTSWNGVVISTQAVTDNEGNIITPAVVIDGWHTNVRVSGQIEKEMTHGLNQYDQDGNLLSVWDRTWAAQVFSLTEVGTDPITKFPTGYRSDRFGVRYCDFADLKTPSLVIA